MSWRVAGSRKAHAWHYRRGGEPGLSLAEGELVHERRWPASVGTCR